MEAYWNTLKGKSEKAKGKMTSEKEKSTTKSMMFSVKGKVVLFGLTFLAMALSAYELWELFRGPLEWWNVIEVVFGVALCVVLVWITIRVLTSLIKNK